MCPPNSLASLGFGCPRLAWLGLPLKEVRGCEVQWDRSPLPKLGVRIKKKHEFYLEINPDYKPRPALDTEFLFLEGVAGKGKRKESRREVFFNVQATSRTPHGSR